MDNNKPHRNWKLFLENSQLPLGPLKGAPIKNRPSMRVDPDDPNPNFEKELDPDQLAMMLARANSDNPATGMKASDRDFHSPSFADDIKLNIGNVSSFEGAKTWDVEADKKVREKEEAWKKVLARLDTLDLKELEEIVLQEIRNILNEKNKANIHREE